MGIFDFVITSIGAFFYWMLSGFKGAFNDYMTGPDKYTWKSTRNLITGFLIFLLIANYVLKAFSIDLWGFYKRGRYY